jgi:hypothetical protein
MGTAPAIPTPSAPTATGGSPKAHKPLFTQTSIAHFPDGSHQITHSGSDGDVRYARSDFDGLKAGLDEHLGGSSGDED